MSVIEAFGAAGPVCPLGVDFRQPRRRRNPLIHRQCRQRPALRPGGWPRRRHNCQQTKTPKRLMPHRGWRTTSKSRFGKARKMNDRSKWAAANDTTTTPRHVHSRLLDQIRCEPLVSCPSVQNLSTPYPRYRLQGRERRSDRLLASFDHVAHVEKLQPVESR